MTNLMNVADYLQREADRLYVKVDRLEREGRATAAYLERLEEAAEHLEEAAGHIEEYFKIKRSLTRRVLDVPPAPGRRPRYVVKELGYAVIGKQEEEEEEEVLR